MHTLYKRVFKTLGFSFTKQSISKTINRIQTYEVLQDRKRGPFFSCRKQSEECTNTAPTAWKVEGQREPLVSVHDYRTHSDSQE